MCLMFLCDGGPENFWQFFVTEEPASLWHFYKIADLSISGIFCDRGPESFCHFFDRRSASFWYFCVTVDLQVCVSF